nr:nucleotide-binding alpha-beta plait domain-containing protein [Tanacetum cinerariifolium]
YRTKEDDVYKISTSVFIINFPESCSAKELFQSCKQYGHVLDTFIPNKRSKTGRRFGFVRFINVFNEERLVNNLCTKENNLDAKHTNKQENHSGDPFSIYKLLKKKKDNVEKENNSEHNMKYPSSFTPKEGTDVVGMHTEESKSDNIVNMSDHNAKEVNNTFSGNCTKKNSKEDVSNSVCSGHFKTSMVPRTGGSILSLMYELVKVGQVMGYKMDGFMSNMTEIIESQGVKEVNQCIFCP